MKQTILILVVSLFANSAFSYILSEKVTCYGGPFGQDGKELTNYETVSNPTAGSRTFPRYTGVISFSFEEVENFRIIVANLRSNSQRQLEHLQSMQIPNGHYQTLAIAYKNSPDSPEIIAEGSDREVRMYIDSETIQCIAGERKI